MIKSFSEFFESISGTELIGPIGPNYGPINLPHKPKSKDTDVVYSEVFGKMVTQDQYQELYQEYLKKGSKPLHGFNLQNLEIVLSKINESINNEDILEYFLDLSDLGARVEFDEDFDGHGTPCIEIILIGGYDKYKNDDCYDFILDLSEISSYLKSFDYQLRFIDTDRVKNLPLSEKLDPGFKFREYTFNQFHRLSDIFELVVSDITFQLTSEENEENEDIPMFRIKFMKR